MTQKHLHRKNMRILLFKIGFIVTISILSCTPRNKNGNKLAIFSISERLDLGRINKILKIDKYISIPQDQELIKGVAELMDSVSKNNFHNLKIEVLGIDTESNFKVLKINLKENPGFVIPDSLGKYHSWYDYFQGTDGGQETTMILTESALQKQFKGDWVDAVEFYYQGEKIGEWDHINLSGLIKRK
jgi:hypothetical protein